MGCNFYVIVSPIFLHMALLLLSNALRTPRILLHSIKIRDRRLTKTAVSDFIKTNFLL